LSPNILADVAAKLQLEFHVECASDGICAIGLDLPEADFPVHCDRIFHDWFDSVEAHAPVTDLASFSNDPVGEGAA
jgi:hypothetical protein